ncbi:hypothetical protein [Gloeobacter kilaueensis]|uniref:Proteasome subunit beta n=1 Tax=Gloeobacter kilaueensis (strain ATCC BAA-2537 / CCAP 1431/1 / ULC 316 / JS1) TaxID=1183438 RepID=U5QIU7_GLOK1|nr:hypothetical protein [Gloeobacter kilaueensis]AGY58821.1 hypothetical protein GKIL_2575 [Gloeobacter kilaueensis JS1]
MTIIVALKVAAGLVVAADSRLTVLDDHRAVFLSDTNFKLFGVRGYPLSVLTCGSSFLEERAIASWLEHLVQDAAGRQAEWSTVADELAQLLPPPDQGSITYLLVGFERNAIRGADAQMLKINRFASGEVHRFDLSNSAIFWDGEFEALTRLLLGFAPAYADLVAAGPAKGQGEAFIPYYAFSLQEGVEYVEFLVRTQIQFQRFAAQPQTCGGAIDVATITPEDGFQWVRRKAIPPYNYLG